MANVPYHTHEFVIPVAGESDSAIGTREDIAMAPKGVKQSIASEVGVTVASSQQGAKADRAIMGTTARSSLLSTLSGFTLVDGMEFMAEGLVYRYKSGATAIPDLPNLLPSGEITINHFGADPYGLVDCKPSVQAAIAYVCSIDPGSSPNVQGFGELIAKAGLYKFDSKATYVETSSRKVNFQIRGEGSFQTTFYASSINTTGILDVSVSGGNEGQFAARDMSFVAKGAGNGTALRFAVSPVGLSRQVRCLVENVSVRVWDADGQWFNKGIVLNGFYYPLIENCTVTGPFGPSVTSSPAVAYADNSPAYNCTVGYDLTDCYDAAVVNCRAWSCDVGYEFSNTINPGSEGGLMLHSGASRVRIGIRRHTMGREGGFIVAFCHFNFRDAAGDFMNLKDVDIVSTLTYNENVGQYGSGLTQTTGIPVDWLFIGCQDVTVSKCRFQFAGDARRVPIWIDNSFGNTEGRQEHRALNYFVDGNDWADDGTFQNCIRVYGISDAALSRRVLRSFRDNSYDRSVITTPVFLVNGGIPVGWFDTHDGRGAFMRTSGLEVWGLAQDGDMKITNGAVSSGATPDAGADNIVIDSTQSNMGVNFLGINTGNQNIYFGDPQSSSIGRIRYNHNGDVLSLRAGGNDIVTLNSTTTDNQTGMVLLTRLAGAYVSKRVEVGAADSGGTGFRMLRVTN